MHNAPPVRQPEEAPFFGVPPARQPYRVTEGVAVNGKRVIVSNEDGFWPDNRAVGKTYRDVEGVLCVMVMPEADWYAWMAVPGTRLPYDKVQVWPATLVYVD